MTGMTDPEVVKAADNMKGAVEFLAKEYSNIHIGRANPSMLEGIMVDCYGTITPIKQVASISVPDAKSLLVAPWDKGVLKELEKSIRESDLGLSPVNDGQAVRIVLPPMTEERRKEIVKHVSKLAEEARISIRNARQAVHGGLKEKMKKAEITEDDFYRVDKLLKEAVEDFNKQVKEMSEAKENEVMTV